MRERLQKQAFDFSRRAMERFLADEQRAQTFAGALGTVQRGRRALDRGQQEIIRALQLASKSEFKALGKALSGLKRRARELEERLATAELERD